MAEESAELTADELAFAVVHGLYTSEDAYIFYCPDVRAPGTVRATQEGCGVLQKKELAIS